MTEPLARLDPDFSRPDATASRWADARAQLEKAAISWLSTVRSDGRPHVTPLISVCLNEALYFGTGPPERKARNIDSNIHCVLTTGCNSIDEGMDVVVEQDAVLVTDEPTLQRVADVNASKYGEPFIFTVHDGAFESDGGKALVFEVRPKKAFGFGKGEAFS